MVKQLGKGGTGTAYLMRERATGELVAIKFIKRPIPGVIKPNIQREIQVCKRVFRTPALLVSKVTQRWQHF
jgi:serine/threonine protein kinase